MLGFIIGFGSLFGLMKVLRAGRGHHACGGGRHAWGGHHGWGHHQGGWGAHGGWGEHREGGERWGGRGGPGFWLRGLFERLDTTPGQEKVIKQAVEEVFASSAKLRGELDQTRKDLAGAMRSGSIDETVMGELFARHDEKLREVRQAWVGALAKVHEALDEGQRKQLADLLDAGFGGRFGGGWGGPYRGGPRAWA